jgi:bacterioferritin-associated ferredoxin
MALLCHCFRVSDRTVRAEAARGVSCPEELAERCGAGAGCGGCVDALAEVLRAHRDVVTAA